MALSLYDVSVVSFLQTVGAVEGFLQRGRDHCELEGVDADSLIETRIHPDMLDFRFQVVSVVHHSLGAIEGVRKGVFSPGGAPGPFDYAGLQRHVAEARQALEAMSPDEVNGLEGRDVAFVMGERRIPFAAEGFLLSFSLPNLHFHATTAYDLLRLKGVPLGKRDYMGRLRIKS